MLNNWYEYRKVEQFEKKLLIDLRATMLSNIKDLDRQLLYNEVVQNECFTLLNYFDNNLIPNETPLPGNYEVFTEKKRLQKYEVI